MCLLVKAHSNTGGFKSGPRQGCDGRTPGLLHINTDLYFGVLASARVDSYTLGEGCVFAVEFIVPKANPRAIWRKRTYHCLWWQAHYLAHFLFQSRFQSLVRVSRGLGDGLRTQVSDSRLLLWMIRGSMKVGPSRSHQGSKELLTGEDTRTGAWPGWPNWFTLARKGQVHSGLAGWVGWGRGADSGPDESGGNARTAAAWVFLESVGCQPLSLGTVWNQLR